MALPLFALKTILPATSEMEKRKEKENCIDCRLNSNPHRHIRGSKKIQTLKSKLIEAEIHRKQANIVHLRRNYRSVNWRRVGAPHATVLHILSMIQTPS